MKKIMAILLTMILVFAMGTVAVSAAASPEVNGVISGTEIKDSEDKAVSMKFEKIDGKVTTEFQKSLKDLNKETNADLKVVAQYDVKVEGNPKFPLKVTLDVLGIANSSKVYIMVQEGNSVKYLAATVVDGKVSFTLENALQKVAIVTDKPTATNVEKENNVLSPQTGDASLAVAVMGVFAVVAAAFAFKKVNA